MSAIGIFLLSGTRALTPGNPAWLPSFNASFDYIVVGGGTAGTILALRLAEAKFSVALVEAGDFYEIKFPVMKIPAAASFGIGSDPNSKIPIDWGFVARGVPGINHRDVHFPRGKCLGGSPTIQSMQRWADLVDDQSYTFDKVLPFYKKTIHFTPPSTRLRSRNATVPYNEDAFDKRGQPIQVSYPNYASPFATWGKLALQCGGINETKDFNSGSLFGSQYATHTIRPSDETRSSSDSALWQSSAFPITLYKKTLAKKIILDHQKRAVAVEAQTAFMKYTLKARREIVLAAGAFQSPQLLMLSGIGPKRAIAEIGIKVIADLPGVGQNLWDHVFFGPTYQVALETYTKLATRIFYLIRRWFEYIFFHTGPMTSTGLDYIGFEKLPDKYRSQFSFKQRWIWPGFLAIGPRSRGAHFLPKDGKQYASILVTLEAPTSRGNITIRSSDAAELPVVNPNWLATKTDQEVAVAAYKRVRDILRSNVINPVIIGDEFFPGPQYQTDRQILDVIRNTAMTSYHPAGTCKMGTVRDPMAVVDSRGRVFGVTRLRVVDASAFPILVPGHPQSTIYMLAEKIAADILSS
ncbi:hypothetical protein FE257_005140 [Aspergillus nanangensis]|uniref:Glucose-methanol-choline oxidoreductase N-terminal domain-containing protein n=1 Tax=Aspergillus nanangensis TaxID=2582783 RepID=A0AAD4GNZ3_ASPNN|nr:hypothetical protein FE257_005140 [Aspergillus nanangensis]